MKPSVKKFTLESEPLWKEAAAIAEEIYSILHELPEDEKWQTTFKLRSSANDLMFVVAQALGDASPSGTEFGWSQARKFISGLKTEYRFAGRQKFIKLDPQIMVRLDKMLEQISAKVEAAKEQTLLYNEQEMMRWRERYELWGKIPLEDRNKHD